MSTDGVDNLLAMWNQFDNIYHTYPGRWKKLNKCASTFSINIRGKKTEMFKHWIQDFLSSKKKIIDGQIILSNLKFETVRQTNLKGRWGQSDKYDKIYILYILKAHTNAFFQTPLWHQ